MTEDELAAGTTQAFVASHEEQERYNEELDLHHDPLKAFYLHGGGVFYNMHELIHSLSEMSDEVFAFHVSKEKDDFVMWVRDVFGMPKLSERMRYFRNKHSLKQFLKTYFESGLAGSGAMRAAASQAASAYLAQAADRLRPEDELQSILFKNKANGADGNIRPLTEDEASEILKKVKEHEQNKYRALSSAQTMDEIDRIKDYMNALKKTITERRKEGKDLFFSGLLLKRIEPQMKIALATNDPKDIRKLMLYVEEMEATFKEESAQQVLDVRSEILMMADEKTRAYDAEQEAKKARLAAQAASQTGSQTAGQSAQA